MKDVIIWLVQIATINGVGYVKANMNMAIIIKENAEDFNFLELEILKRQIEYLVEKDVKDVGII